MKKKSTHCKDCGVEFDGTNKYRARALCTPCAIIEQKERGKNALIPKDEHRKVKYSEFSVENRQEHYSQIHKEVKDMDRDEYKVWLKNKLNEIMQNKKLWEYITTQETFTTQKFYQRKKLASSKNLLENF